MSVDFKFVKLSLVSKIYSGNSINEKVKAEKYSSISDGVEYISTKDISFDSTISYDNGVKIPFSDISNFKLAPKESVFICAEGGSAGRKIAISDRDLCFVNKLFAVVANEKLIPKFLFYALKSSFFQEQFISAMTGIIGGVSMMKFKELLIPLPSIEIQKEIVKKLDTAYESVDSTINLINLNIENSDCLFKAYISEILTKNIDSTWSTQKLEEICTSGRGITYGVIKLGEHIDNGVPCLRTSNVRWLRIEHTDMKSISNEISMDYSRTILHGNEVLVNVRGTLGGVFAVDKFMKGWNISREVAMIPVNTDFINPKFVAYYIATNSSQRWLTSVKKGAAYVGINLEDLRQFKISFPSLYEQNLIVDKLSDFEIKIKNLEEKYIEKLKHLQMLKQSFFDDFLRKDKSYL